MASTVFGRAVRIVLALSAIGWALTACETTQEKSVYKIGKPYQVKGKWYYPKEQPDYDEIGRASWYGERFHGLMTSNGERFDMNKLTAAHRTLPMPSLLRVTNIANGRSVVVRLNDRGPFADDRILDVSRAAARKLGFMESGVAEVRVVYLGPAPLLGDEAASVAYPAQEVQVASASDSGAATMAMSAVIPPAPAVAARAEPVSISRSPRRPAPPPPSAGRATREPPSRPAPVPAAPNTAAPPEAAATPAPPPEAAAAAPAQSLLFVQVASLSSSENASRLKTELEAFGASQVGLADVNGKRFYRVRVGPMTSRSEAEAVRAELSAAGFRGSMIVSQ